MLIKPKGSPLLYFSALYDIFWKKNQKFQVFFQKKVFCAFWGLDIAPTLDVPVLFDIIVQNSKNSRLEQAKIV